MEIFEFEENGQTAYGIQGLGIFQDRTPEGELMDESEAIQLMAEIEERVATEV